MALPSETPIKKSPLKIAAFIETFFLVAVIFLPISKALVELGTTTALVLWGIKKIRDRDASLNLPKSILSIWGFFLGIVFLSLTQTEPELLGRGLRGCLKWIQYLAIFLVAADFYSQRDRSLLLTAFTATMAVVTFNGFIQLATGTDWLRQNSLSPGRIVRMTSSLGAPNTLAAFYLFALPISGILFFSKNRYRFYYIVAATLFVTGLILTFSRAACFALVATSIPFLLMRRKFKVFLLLCAAIFLSLFLSQSIRSNYLASLKWTDITIHARFLFWDKAVKLWQQRPFLGYGVNTYHEQIPVIQTPEGPYKGYAHNSYLQMGVELGGVGVFALAAGLGLVIKFGLRERTIVQDFFAVAILSFLIQSFFDNNFYALQPAQLFWIFLGVFLAEPKRLTSQ